MGVSKNNGTPKSSILIGFSIVNHPFGGTPIFGNTHMFVSGSVYQLRRVNWQVAILISVAIAIPFQAGRSGKNPRKAAWLDFDLGFLHIMGKTNKIYSSSL